MRGVGQPEGAATTAVQRAKPSAATAGTMATQPSLVAAAEQQAGEEGESPPQRKGRATKQLRPAENQPARQQLPDEEREQEIAPRLHGRAERKAWAEELPSTPNTRSRKKASSSVVVPAVAAEALGGGAAPPEQGRRSGAARRSHKPAGGSGWVIDAADEDAVRPSKRDQSQQGKRQGGPADAVKRARRQPLGAGQKGAGGKEAQEAGVRL